MRRRELLKTTAAAALGAPAAALLGPAAASAGESDASAGASDATSYATASYDVAVCEQYKNQIQVYPSDATWGPSTLKWSFSPGAGAWSNLSDIRFRNTAAFGEVALVTASGGKVGIVNVTDEVEQELNDVLWSATPGNNPHAIERIPNIGAIVVATTGGHLYLYGPTAISDPSTLALVQTIAFPAVHGVWYDDVTGMVWAIGDGYVKAFAVSGTYRSTRLAVNATISIGSGSHGHSLDACYPDPDLLLATDGTRVLTISKSTHAVTEVSAATGVKSYSRDVSGEAFWVQATGSTYHGDSRNWVNPDVQFFDAGGAPSFTRGLSYGAEFYKARLRNVNFH
jgi:hypothetical protein